MKVLVRVDGDQAIGLHQWLSKDPVAREVDLVKVGRPGQMGAELVQAVIANMIALPGLVIAVAGYLDNRRRQHRGDSITATFECNGVPIQITGGDPAEIERVIRALTEAEEGPGTQESGAEPNR